MRRRPEKKVNITMVILTGVNDVVFYYISVLLIFIFVDVVVAQNTIHNARKMMIDDPSADITIALYKI